MNRETLEAIKKELENLTHLNEYGTEILLKSTVFKTLDFHIEQTHGINNDK